MNKLGVVEKGIDGIERRLDRQTDRLGLIFLHGSREAPFLLERSMMNGTI